MNDVNNKCAIEVHNDRDMVKALQEAWKETTGTSAPESHAIAFKILLAMMQQHTVSKNWDDATLELMWLSQVMDIRIELGTTITSAREFGDNNVVDLMPHIADSNKTIH